MSLEAISCPYTVLDQLFDGQGGDYRRFTTVAASYFHKLLQEGGRSAEDSAVASGSTNVERVPILNRRSIQTGDVRPNTLVRFIGLVGDVFEPELYAPAVEVQGRFGGKTSRKSCAFRDSLPNEPESHFVQELEQRHNFLCVPLPAETSWARALHSTAVDARDLSGQETVAGDKRKRRRSLSAVGEAMQESSSDSEEATTSPEYGGKRRKAEAADVGENDVSCSPGAAHSSSSSSSSSSRQRATGVNLGFPHPGNEFDVPCLVRVYQPSESALTAAPPGCLDPSLRLGDMVEVVGILSGDAVMPTVAGAMNADAEDDEDGCFGRPQLALPSALVPRVHAILYRPLAATYPVMQPATTAESQIELPTSTKLSAVANSALRSDGSANEPARSKDGASCRVIRPFDLQEPSLPALLGLRARVPAAPHASAANTQPSNDEGMGGKWLETCAEFGGSGASADAVYLAAASQALQQPSVLQTVVGDCRKTALQSASDACFDSIFSVSGGEAPSASYAHVADSLRCIPMTLRQKAWGAAGSSQCSASSSLLPPTALEPAFSAVHTPGSGVNAIRSLLAASLTAAVGGDALAGEYLLLHLLSSVSMRQEPVAVVGKMTLNLQGFPEPVAELGGAGGVEPASAIPKDTAAVEIERNGPLESGASPRARGLQALLAQLLPRSALLPLTIQKLNYTRFAPRKDAETDRMLAGVLQLASGTHVVVDSTVLQPGKLQEQGVMNLRELQGVINDQTLSLHFPYHSQKLPVDIQVLLLSAGRSLVKPDIELPLSKDARDALMREASLAAEAAPGFCDEQTLHLARVYLALARNLSYRIPDGVRDSITEDLALLRRGDRAFGPEAMHRMLGLAKLLAMSHGEKELSVERWRQVREMENERQKRLAEPASQSGGNLSPHTSSSVHTPSDSSPAR